MSCVRTRPDPDLAIASYPPPHPCGLASSAPTMEVPTTPSLISLFDSVCFTDGDNAAFISGSSSQRIEVGFTELRESSIAIASELCHRHGVGSARAVRIGCPAKATKCDGNESIEAVNSDKEGTACNDDPNRPAFNDTSLPPSVLVVSGYPSAGEAAAVLACTRLRVPFVPVDLIGPNCVGMQRLHDMLSDVLCRIAIVVVDDDISSGCSSTSNNGEQEEDNFLTSPALQSTTNAQLDQHPAVKMLERAKVFRHVMISARDGTLLNGLGLSDLALPTPVVEESDTSLRDPLYVLYTSGSTSRSVDANGRHKQRTGKGVVQAHSGLMNRILWQWKTFPFTQQIRSRLGPVEAKMVLDADGITEWNDLMVRRTPLSFVDSICEIFATLLAGVPLWCPSASLLQEEGLAGIIEEAGLVGATRITCLPSQLMQMIRLGTGAGVDFGKEQKEVGGWPWKSLNVAVVSGEPCPSSLPTLWERAVCEETARASKLLVNLYGQTETSADVLCAVVSTGGRKAVARFPNCSPHIFLSDNGSALTGGEWWRGPSTDKSQLHESLERCLKWTVPCGIPISRHNLIIGSPSKERKSSVVGRLNVMGPGLALGYLNRTDENSNSFENVSGVRWFDTSDLAYCDSENDFFYIIGRADENENSDNEMVEPKSSAAFGKINGVLVHTEEVVAVFVAALTESLRQAIGDESARLRLADTLSAAAVLHDTADKAKGGTTGSQTRRLSLFVDLSTFPSSLRQPGSESNIGPDVCQLISPREGLSPAAENALLDAKVLLLGSTKDRRSRDLDDFVCHRALVPHTVYLVSRLPTTGAAAKVDRSALVAVAAEGPKGREASACDGCFGSKSALEKLIWSTFDEVLSFDSSSQSVFSFAELGGDSMMAIECAHKLNMAIRREEAKAFNDIHISAADIVEYSVEGLCAILSGTKKRMRGTVAHTEGVPDAKADRDRENSAIDLTRTLGGPLFSQKTKPDDHSIEVEWKSRLLMCVDASPLLLRHRILGDLVIIGSQGGDVLCCHALSGDVLHRQSLSGKIEGGMSTLQVDGDAACSSRTLMFVCSYSNKTEMKGRLSAFEVSRKMKVDSDENEGLLSLLWTREVPGQLKSSPACFKLTSTAAAEDGQDAQSMAISYGVLTTGYDGVLRYFDAISGVTIASCSGLGGALHARASLFQQNNSGTCALVASSTWTGRLTCVQLQKTSMTRLWFVDLWAPVYASPMVCSRKSNGRSVAIFGAIDGAVRCVDLDAGIELWKTSNSNNKPIFSGCTLIRKMDAFVVGCHDGSVSCISLETGTILWVHKGESGSAVLGTPALITEGSSYSDSVIFGSTSGDIACLASNNGKLLKRTHMPLDGEIFSSPLVNGKNSVFVGVRDSYLYKLSL